MSVLRRVLLAVCLGLVPAAAQAGTQSFETVERGRALATIGDCIACHTVPGGTPFAGGRAIETPFGNVVTPNLTPDRETGLGATTDAEFLRALQQGIGRNGQHLYPAFPYPYYSRVSSEDLLAIRAYLATLDPVRNPVRRNQLNFPFDIRLSMAAWNALYFEPGALRPVAGKSAMWNRGAAIVLGLGHCAACHTPKTALGGDDAKLRLQGGAIQNWFAPALNNDPRTGLGAWSENDVVEYLATGRNAKSAASGPMGEVVAYSTSHMPRADLQAIAVYLKDQQAPASAAPAPMPPADPVMLAGAAIYTDNCSACHTLGGGGIARLFPSLRDNAVVQSANPVTPMRVVLTGARAIDTDAAPTGPAMPPFGWKLSDAQVAAVLTYIRNSWGNAAAPVSTEAVETLRATLARSGG